MGTSAKTAISSSLTASTLKIIGINAMAGLKAGIEAGKSGVVSAMRTAATEAIRAAKTTLRINSPSRVFRDEVGVMVMKGFGEGILSEERSQARIVQNAARYMTENAQKAVVPVNQQTTNNRTYNASSNLTVQTMIMQNEMDAQALSAQMNAENRRLQRGYGS